VGWKKKKEKKKKKKKNVNGARVRAPFRYRNVTNQPSFSSGVACDNIVTLYNSSVTVGEYAPVVVKGSVSIVAPYFPVTTTFRDVYGLKVDRAFIENNYVACSGLKGYSGTGSGD
jgi:hypothetical protein